jgi:transcriptional regulator with XRE-family HTH domain
MGTHTTSARAGLFPALLKHWRGQRGLSQLDLALTANVSSRHVSFLETGRAAPGAAMVLRLAAALDIPLRHVNAMLRAAGHEPAWPEPASGQALPPEVGEALRLMKVHHDPFPLLIVDRGYEVLDMNEGARALLRAALSAGGAALPARLNLLRLTFDPDGAQPFIVNFQEVGRAALWRLQREVLADLDDGTLRGLLEELLAMPTVSAGWRDADLTVPASPALVLHLRVGALELRFVTTITAFQAPQTVSLDELRIETWYPCDAATAAACRALVGEG